MAYGGFGSYPFAFGGGPDVEEVICDALSAARGSAIANDETSIAWLENFAIAREIAGAWATNEALSNMWDPYRCSPSTLTRWETILAVPRLPTDTVHARRQRVAKRMGRFGEPSIYRVIVDALEEALGTVFVGLEFISLAIARIHVPDASPAFPFGTVALGFPWYSTVQHILIRTQKPAGYTEGEFWDAIGKIAPLLEDMLPVDCTYDWYRAPDAGAPIVVAGGPSAGGFYLDEPNLDLLVFDA